MNELDNYHKHEVLDRTHMLLLHIENALSEHPIIVQDAEAKALCLDAANALFGLYQYLGRDVYK